MWRVFAFLAAVLLAFAANAQAQSSLIILDENDVAGAQYRLASAGTFSPPDILILADDSKLPTVDDQAYSGESSGSLTYQHLGGSWRMAINRIDSAPFDVSGFDSLVVYVNGPEALIGAELPDVGLADANRGETASNSLGSIENVQVDELLSGVTPESETDLNLDPRYVTVWPATVRRHGYPENIEIRFSDEPVDTSEAAIGLDAVPAYFEIVTESGLRPAFRFLDSDGDGTLSGPDEYVEIRFRESLDSDRLVTTWRLTAANVPSIPPGEGDVYRLVLSIDEFTLDGDPDTWQRVSLPLDAFQDDGAFDPTVTQSVVFRHGGRNPEVRTLWFDQLLVKSNDDDAFLDMIQRDTFDFFWYEANPENGLVRDRTTGNYSSIAAVGFGLSAITVGIDRGWITPEEGRERILTTLEFFWNAPQSTAVDATGYRGFFYHFLDMDTGRRSGPNELSTIDTALLLGGVLHVREYFVDDEEIRSLADSIYDRVDWQWMQYRNPNNPTAAISHGWYPDPEGRGNADPETGFIVHDWIGYNEAMILYILALGSPTHPVGPEAWEAWVSGYDNQWRKEYGYTYLTFPPLFGHQYSHVWIDFRGIRDEYMRKQGIDYFENSRRATLAQRAYHIANPRGWSNYSKDEWGLTASDTPDGYRARGAPPPQNDDGTLAPTAPGGSIVFTPDESIAALRTMYRKYGSRLYGPYGFRDAYHADRNWFAETYLGIDQGPILLMIENHRTETIWEMTMRNDAIRRGLEQAGFSGEALSEEESELNNANRLEIYPNPASGLAMVDYSLSHAGPVRLVLYDVLGREMHRLSDGLKTAGRHQDRLTMEDLSNGAYFLVLEQEGRRLSRMIIKKD